MDRCYDQIIDEHYTEQDSQKYHSEENSGPYNPLIMQPNTGLAKRVLTTDEICDDENFPEEDRNRGGSSIFSKN